MPPSRRPYRVTIDNVARRASVSISTVSRVINRAVGVSDEAAGPVEAAVRELNYWPRAAARNLGTCKTHAVGLLISETEGDFIAPLRSGVKSVTSEAGHDLLISTSGRLGPRAEFPASLGAHNTHGMLVFAHGLGPAGLTNCYAMGFPAVLIHESLPDGLDIPCVTVENKEASRDLVKHLVEMHGRRRIAFLRGLEGQKDSFWREACYLTPSLTTVRTPTEEVGCEAGRQPLSLLQRGQAHSLTLLPSETVIRGSCGCREG